MRLRKLEEKDIPYMLEWMHDPEIAKNFRFPAMQATAESVKAFIKAAENNQRDLHCAVVNDDDEYLGTASLKNIDHDNKNAELALAFRKKAIGTGAARFASEELLKRAFFEWGLCRIYANVLSANARSLRFCDRMGFVCEGEFRKHVMVNGELQDLKWYGCLREDYHV